jgi:hypothetical protein
MNQLKRGAHDRQPHYRYALGYFTDPALRARTFQYALSSEVRTQDAPDVIAELMSRPANTAATWADLKANWESVQRNIDVFQGLPRIVRSLGAFCDQPGRDDVSRFFEAHAIRALDRNIRQTIESIDRCAAMKEYQRKNLAALLQNPSR